MKNGLTLSGYGDKFWYKNDLLHRECEDGPAAIYADGQNEWWFNGKRHREDGPAIEGTYGNKCWYLNGIEVTEEVVMALREKKNLEVSIIQTKTSKKVKL